MAGVLFACMVADAEDLAGLDAWYDRDHLPGRMGVPGFRRATRYHERSTSPRRATACLYELTSAAVLSSPAYRSVQERTDADTRAHLGDLPEMWRLVGDVEPPAPADDGGPAALLVAALVERGGAPPVATSDARRVRRVATTWEQRPLDLVLAELDAPPPAPVPPHGDGIVRAWLLERTGGATPTRSSRAACS